MAEKIQQTINQEKFINYIKKPVYYAAMEGIFMAAPWGVLAIILPGILEESLSVSSFLGYFACFLALFICRFFISLCSNRKAIQGGYETGHALRMRLGEHLRRLPMGFFSDRAIGELSNRVFMNVEMLEMMISHFLVQTVSNFTMPLVILLILFYMDPALAMVSFCSLVLAGWFLFLLIRMLGRLGKEKIQVQDKSNATILEYLHGIKVFKSFNLTGLGLFRLQKDLARLRDFSLDLEVRAFSLSLTYSAVLEIGFVLVFLMGIWQMGKGNLGAPVLFGFFIVCRMFYRPLHELVTNAALTRATIAEACAVMEILEKPCVGVPENPVSVSGFDLDFADVSFAYQRGKQVLSHVSFKARGKSLTALVGESGSGKSTLINLAARFWDVDSGSICIGGNDIRRIDPELLMAQISLVSQDVYLFNDTIAGNIAMGRERASRQEIIKVAKQALCHDFISALPEGYDTMVGEGGTTLSGGEKQRISIARAFLKDAPIILLDEASASLDPENDLLIQRAIDSLVESKTVIIVAHRLYTVMNARNIIVLEKGRIIETGNHETLMEKNGLYARMWNEQQDFSQFIVTE